MVSTGKGRGPKHHRGDVMAIKNVVIPLEVEYLQQAAKECGVSRTMLVRIMMQKIVRDILGCEYSESTFDFARIAHVNRVQGPHRTGAKTHVEGACGRCCGAVHNCFVSK